VEELTENKNGNLLSASALSKEPLAVGNPGVVSKYPQAPPEGAPLSMKSARSFGISGPGFFFKRAAFALLPPQIHRATASVPGRSARKRESLLAGLLIFLV